MAASCQRVCPKGAIEFENGRSHINQSKCIKCGKCAKACPYNAIVHLERPCAASCGMDAIGSDEQGRAVINQDKCVACGQCLVSCPFGAIVDKGQIFQVIQSILKGDKVIAIVAPAFIGQFSGKVSPGKFVTAMKMLGFDRVVEVAIGADMCTIEEAKDFMEKVPAEQDYMATSCCPAWHSMIEKLFPTEMRKISMTLTPMVFTARMMKKDFPGCKVVFVGPCAAKKLEAIRADIRSDVDFVLTFEELMGMFEAKEIDFAAIEEAKDFLEKVPAEQNYMATSCCPAWHSMIEKLYPSEMEKISMTLTPMVFTARMMKKDFPGCKVVFVGPCAAKKLEAIRADIRSDVDFVMTFEELQGMFEAKEIDFDTIEEQDYMNEGTGAGRGFAVAGGVAKAVTDLVHEKYPDMEIQTARAEGLRECKKLMALAKAGKYNGYLLEGMACPGGCVAGAGTILPVEQAQKLVAKYSKEAHCASPTASAYKDRGEDLD